MSDIGEKEKLKLIKECLRKLSVSFKLVAIYCIQARNSKQLFFSPKGVPISKSQATKS